MPRANILVVDTGDNLLAERVRAALGECYQVEGAFTGEESIGLIKKKRFDLLIGEIEAPDCVGLSLAERVRGGDPVIAMILIGDYQSVEGAFTRLRAGPQTLIAPRFTASKLRRAVEDTLERSRLMRDNKRLQALLPLFEVSKTLISEVELGKLLDVILEIVWRETEADSVSLMLLDESQQELVVTAVLDPLKSGNNGKEKVGEGIAGCVARTAKSLMLTEETPVGHPLRRAMSEMGISSVLCLPLVVKGKVIGVLRASSKRGGAPFGRSDLEFLSILCGQAAIAIENARLFSGVKTQQARVEQLLNQALLAQERERQRISLEIHDGAAQWMVGASYRVQAFGKLLVKSGLLQSAEELFEVRGVIDETIGELRRVIFDLQPPDLGELGLEGALRQNLQSFERDTGTACSFQIEGTSQSLPPIVEIAVYRVAQEALANVRKHAQATRVDVILRFEAGDLCLKIGDNGKGFILSEALNGSRSGEHLGLSGMKDRAETLGGTLKIETAEGVGTTVALTLPFFAPVPGELSPVAAMLSS
jgi:signal transduction histidine kinase